MTPREQALADRLATIERELRSVAAQRDAALADVARLRPRWAAGAAARARLADRRNETIASMGMPTSSKSDWARVRDVLQERGFDRLSVSFLRRSYREWQQNAAIPRQRIAST